MNPVGRSRFQDPLEVLKIGTGHAQFNQHFPRDPYLFFHSIKYLFFVPLWACLLFSLYHIGKPRTHIVAGACVQRVPLTLQECLGMLPSSRAPGLEFILVSIQTRVLFLGQETSLLCRGKEVV